MAAQELISMMALVCCAQAVFSGKKKEHDEAESAIQEEENKLLSLQRRQVLVSFHTNTTCRITIVLGCNQRKRLWHK